MTTQVELTLNIGAKFYAEITCAESQTGRTHRAQVRVTKSTITTKMDLITGDGITIHATNPKILILQKGATATELIVCPTDSAIWLFDCESTGATADDVVREAEGSVLVTRDVTRATEATADADASKLLTFSLTDGQTLTTPEQTALQTKIGITGGSASAVLYTAQTLTAPQQTQALTNQGVTAAGRAVAQAADASAQRTALELGSAATTSASAYATAAQGTNDRTASGLRTATTVVSVLAATAPSSGQVLTATGDAAATWQTPSVGGVAIGDAVSGASDGAMLYTSSGLLANSEKFRIVTGFVSGVGATPLITGSNGYSGSICLEFGGVVLGRLDEAPPAFGAGHGVELGGFVGPGGGFWFSYSENNLFSTPDLGITKSSSTKLQIELAAGGLGDLAARVFNPDSIADSAAPVSSIYYSTTAGKLVYKDAGGTVNALY